MPVSPLPASDSKIGSPHGSLPDLERTGYRARTMEEKINEIYLRTNTPTGCEPKELAT